jgi:hypothetical protein
MDIYIQLLLEEFIKHSLVKGSLKFCLCLHIIKVTHSAPLPKNDFFAIVHVSTGCCSGALPPNSEHGQL